MSPCQCVVGHAVEGVNEGGRKHSFVLHQFISAVNSGSRTNGVKRVEIGVEGICHVRGAVAAHDSSEVSRVAAEYLSGVVGVFDAAAVMGGETSRFLTALVGVSDSAVVRAAVDPAVVLRRYAAAVDA